MSDYDEEDYDDPEYVIDAWADDVGKDHPDDDTNGFEDDTEAYEFRLDVVDCECQGHDQSDCDACCHKVDCPRAVESCWDACHDEFGDSDEEDEGLAECDSCELYADSACLTCYHETTCPSAQGKCSDETHLIVSELKNRAMNQGDEGASSTLIKVPDFVLQEPEKPYRHMARWEIEEDLELRQEYLDRVELNSIAKKHERTSGAIMGRLTGMCFPKFESDALPGSPEPARHQTPWSEDDDEAISRSWREGASVLDIASAQQRKPFSVASRLIKLYVPVPLEESQLVERRNSSAPAKTRSRRLNDSDVLRLTDMLMSGSDLEVIAAVLQRPVSALVATLASEGLLDDSDLNLLTPVARKALELRNQRDS